MNDAIWLVEIYRLPDVGWNYFIVLTDLRNAIDLNGEKDRNTSLFKFSRQRNCLRCSPAVAEYHDAGIPFFLRRKRPVIVNVQPPLNFLIGLLAITIFKRLNVRSRGILLAKMPYDLDGAVNGVVMFDKAPDKTNHDGRRLAGCFRRDYGYRWARLRAGQCGQGEKTKDSSQDRDTTHNRRA